MILELIKNGVPLNLNSSITWIVKNPIFVEEFIQGSFTLPFVLDMDDHNRKALGFPEDPANDATLARNIVVTFRMGGHDREVNLRFNRIAEKADCSLSGGAAVFGEAFKGQKLREMDFGSVEMSKVTKVQRYVFDPATVGGGQIVKFEINFVEYQVTYNSDIPQLYLDLQAAINSNPNAGCYANAGIDSIQINAPAPGIENAFDSEHATDWIYWDDYTVGGWNNNLWAWTHHTNIKSYMLSAAQSVYPNKPVTFYPLYNTIFYGPYDETVNAEYTGIVNSWNAVDFHGNMTTIDSGVGSTYNITPFVYLFYVLDHIFAEVDYTVSGNFMTDPEYKKLTLYNNRALDHIHWLNHKTDLTFFGDTNLWKDKFNIADHLPDMTVGELINSLSINFRLAFFFDDYSKTLRIMPVKDIIGTQKKRNLTGNAIKGTVMLPSQYEGITLSYEREEKEVGVAVDPYYWGPIKHSDGIKEITSKLATCPPSSSTEEYSIVGHLGNSTEFELSENEFLPRLIIYRGFVGGKPRGSFRGDQFALSWDGPDGLFNIFWIEYLELISHNHGEQSFLLPPFNLTSIDPEVPINNNYINWWWKRYEVSVSPNKISPVKMEMVKI